MSSSPPIGLAILGAGIFATEALVQHPHHHLKAVYSRSEKSAQELSSKAAQALKPKLSPSPSVYHDSGDESCNLDALLARSDIQAVIVVLPISVQPKIVVKALEAGKHVLSEKPVAADVKQGIELIRVYNDKYKPRGLIWKVAENYEAEPGYRKAAELVREGRIGQLIQFKAVVEVNVTQESKYYKTSWRTVPDYQGGFLLDGGVHTAAVLRTVIPSTITHISSFASLNKEYLAPHDSIHAIVKAGPQIHGTASFTFAWPTKSTASSEDFIFTGTKGWLSIIDTWDTEEGRVKLKIVTRKSEDSDEETEEVIEEAFNGVTAELVDFLKAVEGKGELGLGDPAGALKDVAFIEAALNSNGAVIDITNLVPAGL
ncbi:oxidoreductase family protein [Amanita muscaria]